jgi:hypothetical protein
MIEIQAAFDIADQVQFAPEAETCRVPSPPLVANDSAGGVTVNWHSAGAAGGAAACDTV